MSFVQNPSKYVCANCKKFLSHFPIYVHPVKGWLCGRCPKPSGENILRNEIYENLAQTLKFPCCYQSNGCTENMLPSYIPTHERLCYFRKYVCPSSYYGGCTWEGMVVNLLEHFEQKHVTFLLKDGQFEIDFINSHQENYLFPYGDDLYVVNRKTDSKTGTFACTVTYIGIKPYPEDFYYKLILQSTNSSDVHVVENKLSTTSYLKSDIIRDILSDPISIIAQIEIIEPLNYDTILAESDDNLKSSDVNYELLRELECLVCMEYMIPPIHQCLTGHSICLRCKERVSECPTCKQEFKNTQNFALAQIINLIVYPCKYSKCKFTAKAKDIRKHEANCIFGPFACPLKEYEQCNAEMPITDLYDHIVNNHVENLLELDTVNEPFNKSSDDEEQADECCYILKYSFRLFKLHYLYEDGRFCWAMQLIGPSEESVKYKFEIDIIDTSGSNRRVYLKSNCSALTDQTQAFNLHDSYVYLDFDQISSMVSDELRYRVRVFQE